MTVGYRVDDDKMNDDRIRREVGGMPEGRGMMRSMMMMITGGQCGIISSGLCVRSQAAGSGDVWGNHGLGVTSRPGCCQCRAGVAGPSCCTLRETLADWLPDDRPLQTSILERSGSCSATAAIISTLHMVGDLQSVVEGEEPGGRGAHDPPTYPTTVGSRL